MSMLLMVQAMSCHVGNPARKLVLLKLADNANDQGMCFPSYRYIAECCEISKRSAQDHILALSKMGLLSIERRVKNNGDNSSNVYFLTLESGKASDSNASQTPIAESAPPIAESAPPIADSAPITSQLTTHTS